ncbi:MAG TPA: diacylglycerol kinase family protein [Clostridiales bacterium]|nr:diacylglycerol kinase family protein [Clostridiales bacterium]
MRKAKSLKESFSFAWRGFCHCFAHERNFRIHLVTGVAVLFVALFLDVSLAEFALLLLLIAVVIASEMFNTAIETIIDLISPEYHPLAKVIKDVAAGAVFFVCITAVLIGVVIFVPHLHQLLIR